jgi:hypothetical protein
VLKYISPAASASPSLSNVGSEALAPRYLSSNSSRLAAALAALVAAADAELAEAVADAADAVAEVDAALA